MSDVNVQVLRAGIDAIRRLVPGLEVDALIERLQLRERLDSGARVPWPIFVALIAEMREGVGGRDAMIELGRRIMRGGTDLDGNPFRVLSRRLLSTRRLYQLAFALRHRSNYPFLTLRMHEPRPGQLDACVSIPEPLVGSPGYFEILTGQIETLPGLIGRPAATLELVDIDERVGYWRIRLPTRGTWLMRGLEQLQWRRATLRAELGLELDMLERQHERLRRAYAALEAESSRREQAERSRRELERQLLHQQRLELIGHMTGGIAHDFNNILQAIGGSVELLAHELQPEPGSRVAEEFDELEQALASARDLTRQLLGFSRAQSDGGAVDVDVALARLTRMLRRMLPRTIELACTPPSEPLSIPLEQVEFEQLLINLVVNARDAMPAGGTITLRVSAAASDRVRIEVIDDGLGMDADTRARMFEPFFTTKPEARGTGLGLAIVLGLVERHGGTLDVDSTLGGGTRFAIELPRRDVHAPRDPASDVLSADRRSIEPP